MKNIVIINDSLEKDDLFNSSLIRPENIILKQADISDNINNVIEFINNLEPGISQIDNIAFMYHYPGYDALPFFYDEIKDMENEDIENNPEIEKYRYFTNNIVELLGKLKSDYGLKTMDVLTCSLDISNYRVEAEKLEKEIGIQIRYSFNDVGNSVDWILESHNIDVRDIYFNNNILQWKHLLNTGISLNGYVNALIDNTTSGVYRLTRDVSINEIIPDYNNNWFILGANEIFDGAGFTIDLSGETTEGLFAFNSITDFDNAPTIKNLGVLNGTILVSGSGYIIRRDQPFFKVDSCYNTQVIKTHESSGIAGGSSGINGKCLITNCYNTGSIISRAGGIVGNRAGSSGGNCVVSNCYNTGTISGGAGGIVGGNAGRSSGNCLVSNCYNTGIINEGSGGIVGSGPGIGGICFVTNCYNRGSISINSGGIIGNNGFGFLFGRINCAVSNCYNTGVINNDSGGIVGSELRETVENNYTVTNCYNIGAIAINATNAGDIAGRESNISQFNTYGLTTGGGQNALNNISDLTITNTSVFNKSTLLNMTDNSGIETFLDRTMEVTPPGNADGIVIPLLNLYDGINNDIQFNDRGFTIGWYGNQLNEHSNIIETVSINNNASGNESRTVKLITDTDNLYNSIGSEFDIYYYTYAVDISFSILNEQVSISNDIITIGSVVYPKNSIVNLETPVGGSSIYLRSLGAEYTPVPIVLTNNSKWIGGVLAPNGKIYGIPYDSSSVLIIDPETNQADTSITGLDGNSKWAGGVLASNGKIYGIPYDSPSVLIIDPETEQVNTSSITGLNGLGKWAGGVLAPNGKIYGIPYDSSSVLVIDTGTNPENISYITGLIGERKWLGGVLAPNGKIYGIPYDSSSILVIDTDTDTISYIPLLVGNNSGKWIGGVLAPNGKIYGIPSNSSSILVIDPETDTIVINEIIGITGQFIKWTGGILGLDGNIYGIPYNNSSVLIIDPDTEEVNTTDITGLVSGGEKWFGGVLVPNGKIYGMPSNSSSVSIIRPGLPRLPTWMISAYFNKF